MTPQPVPTLTKHQPYGHVTIEWPDPLSQTYDVSHEVIQEWVDTENRIADVHRLCHAGGLVQADAVLRLLGITPPERYLTASSISV